MHTSLFLKIDSANIRMSLAADSQPTLELIAFMSDAGTLWNDAGVDIARLPWNLHIKRAPEQTKDGYGSAAAQPYSGDHTHIFATYDASPESFDCLEALLAQGMRSLVLDLIVADIRAGKQEKTLQWNNARDGSNVLQIVVCGEFATS